MEGKKQGWGFLIGVIGLSLSLLTAFFAKAEDAYQPTELTAREKMIFQRTLNPSGGDADERCKDSVAVEREQGDTRSEEALMSACLALPSDHAQICGIPREPGQYSIIENDRCYTLDGGIQQHAHARKVEARERGAGFYDPVNKGDTTPTITGPGDDNTGSAQ